MCRTLALACLSMVYVLSTCLAADTDAPVVANNPDGAQYIAMISKNGLNAEIVAETPLHGQGVQFTININGPDLAAENYLYHLHELAVPEDGNCTATKAHLDPYKRGEEPICDRSNPASCQVGDLSGKHGDIPTLPGFSTTYTDDYVSLIPGTDAFMGDKSLVLHFPNKTRIACANFKLVPKYDDASGTAGNGTMGNSVGGYGARGNSTASVSHATILATATSSTSSVPIGGGVTAEGGAAGKMKNAHDAAVVGPFVLGLAVAMW